MLKLTTAARKLKVTTIIDAIGLSLPENASGRMLLAIRIGDNSIVKADLAIKSVRKALKVVAEVGPENVVVLLQGALDLGSNSIVEAGIVAQIKAKKDMVAPSELPAGCQAA